MSLLFMDGFSGQDSLFKWDPGSIGYTSATATPRVPGGYYATTFSFNGPWYSKSFTPSAKVIIGLGYKMADTASTAFSVSLYGDTGGTQHITVLRNYTTGLIEIRRGAANGTLLATGTQPVFQQVWNYIEISATISDTVGEVHVRLNGQTSDEVSYTGDTKNGGTSTNIDKLGIIYASNLHIADLYVLNDSGSAPLNNFLGDVTVRTLAPAGNGTYSQLTGSDGDSLNNYQLVDEHPFSGTDYVGSAVSGQKDSYTMADLPAGVTTVYALQVSGSMSKTDATLAQSRYFVRSGGTDYGGTTRALTTSFVGYYDMYTTDPATGLPWTVAAVNNAEPGMEVM
jgi:hypothetical protein